MLSTWGATRGAGYTLPNPTGLISLGDSRVQLSGGLTGSGTSVIDGIGNGHGFAGRIYSDLNNVVRACIGYNFGITSSTSRCAEIRMSSSSTAATGNSAGDAPPAGTGVLADVKFNTAALGDYSVVSHPSNIVFCMSLINDIGVSWYTNGTGSGGDGSNTLGIMKSCARIADTIGAANKVMVVGETPKGPATIWQETKAVASGTFTATNTTGFVGGADFSTPVAEVVTAAGAVLTKVASGPVAGQYSVTSGGVYTVDAGLNATNVYITYAFQSVDKTSDNLVSRDLNEWLQSSSAAPFVAPTSGNSYAIAGLKNSRPWVIYADTYGATVGSGNNGKAGMFGNDTGFGTHPGKAGATAAGAAVATAFGTAYPGVTTSLRNPPSIGSFECGNSGGSTHYKSSTGLGGALQLVSEVFNTASPPPASECRFVYTATAQAGPTILLCTDIGGGLYRISGTFVDPDHNNSTENIIDTATGHWDVWLTQSSGSRIYFERDFNNAVPNCMFDYDYGAGTKSGSWTGTAPKNWTIACTDTGLGSTLTVAIDDATVPVVGKNGLQVDINGLAGTGPGITITSSNNQIANRIVVGGQYVLEALIRVEPGSNGSLYGLWTAHARISAVTGGSADRGAYTGVTAYGADTEIGTINFPMTDMDLTGGAYVSKILSPILDFAAPMTVTSCAVSVTINWQASKPVSARVYVTEIALRRVN